MKNNFTVYVGQPSHEDGRQVCSRRREVGIPRDQAQDERKPVEKGFKQTSGLELYLHKI